MNPSEQSGYGVAGGLASKMTEQTTAHLNLGQVIITVPEDRLRLKLRDHQDVLQRRNEWHAPLGTTLALLLAFCTADFRDAFGVKSEQWGALCFVCLVIAFVWLIVAAYRAYRATNTIDSLIAELKGPVQIAIATEIAAKQTARVAPIVQVLGRTEWRSEEPFPVDSGVRVRLDNLGPQQPNPNPPPRKSQGDIR